MKITQAPVLSLEDDRVRRRLLDALERVEPALGASVSALPDPKVVGAHMHRNMTGLVIGLAGAIAALGGVQLAGQAMDEKMALMALLIGIAFAGLALVGLFGLVGIWLENFAAQRLTLLQSRLDAAEDNELAVTG